MDKKTSEYSLDDILTASDKATGGMWIVKKTVDNSGDYPFPSYTVLALFDYGPQGIGEAYQNPYNAILFSGAKRLAEEVKALRLENEQLKKKKFESNKTIIIKVPESPCVISELEDNNCTNSDIDSLHCEWFIYSYECESYEGSGFAVWRKGNEFFYDTLSHCSCYGPLEHLHSIGYTFTELEKIASNSDYISHSMNVIRYIKQNGLESS